MTKSTLAQRDWRTVTGSIRALTDGETDTIAKMATIACELFHGHHQFDWVGFYRVVKPGLLKIGPYQGGHGCLTIPFDRGVCGAAARQEKTQLVPDVSTVPDHIACAATTRSEIVVPVFSQGRLIAVLDVDSNTLDAFNAEDVVALEAIAEFAFNQ